MKPCAKIERTPSLVVFSAGGGRIAKLGPIVQPAVSTLLAGIRSYSKASLVAIISGTASAATLVRNVTRLLSIGQLKAGDMFVWVGEAGRRIVPWGHLRSFGVYTIYYQTEPWDVTCALYNDQVHELWDFSWHNLEACRERYYLTCYQCNHSAPSSRNRRTSAHIPVLRWVPLGALPARHPIGHPAHQPPLAHHGL